jgi:hypothetical protein
VLLALAMVAHAAPGDASSAEEIIVYGDDFARWDHTRWLVQSELLLPLGVPFAAERNESFMSYAFQLRAIVGCEKDGKLSGSKWEVSCKIEDIGILATAHPRYRSEKDRALVQRVLDEIDAKLTGVDIQMQVDKKGGVTNVDLEGIQSDNLREREIQESLRQVLMRVMAGFHLRIPDHAQREGQWVEYHSELMEMPSLTSSRGSTTLVHEVSPYKGDQLVQTVGEGSVSVRLPTTLGPEQIGNVGGSDTSTSLAPTGGGGLSPSTISNAPNPDDAESVLRNGGAESDVEVTYQMSATGVALFEKSTGIMVERVWACKGIPTASIGVISGPPYRNIGRIQMLGDADKPDVGPTKQVSLPGSPQPGLDPWVDLEDLPK